MNNVFEIGSEMGAGRLFDALVNRDGALVKRRFVRFLESSADADNVFYAYTTAVEKTVREEVEVDEEREC